MTGASWPPFMFECLVCRARFSPRLLAKLGARCPGCGSWRVRRVPVGAR